jgi:hypothetical protein
MTKKIICLSISCITLIFFLSGCRAKYKLDQTTDNIEKIEIIEVSDEKTFVLQEVDDYVVLKEIDDIQAFIDDFKNVDCFIHFTDPVQIIAGIAIKIYYSNGDNEIITSSAQQRYVKGKYDNGYRYFDTDGFNNFINKYVE